ncbi:Dolichyl-diphosphooligosaccharide--protein glycosyltransferase subunit WBP1 [Phlyctochytrium arcticum]|nr:Dolichyl-diphosphooligosaccharide--protein glycosyltransferase subunit WBP1 [Phlyctochytrium arcticum]
MHLPIRLLASLLSLLVCASPVWTRPVNGTKTLVLVDELKNKDAYSTFLKGLEERGHALDFKAGSSSSDFELVRYGEREYDHLVILSPKVKGFGGDLGIGGLLDFVNTGGNILLAASSDISEPLRDFAYEFSVDFDPAGSAVQDHFHAVHHDAGLFLATKHVGSDAIIPKSARGPILFRGVGHRVTKKNQLVQPLLVASSTAFSFVADGKEELTGDILLGNEIALVSAMQARNNARVVFAGSVDMFSDKLLELEVGKDTPKPVNNAYITSLSQWVFQETGVLRVNDKRHHRHNETAQHGIYRIKDDLVYEISISEWKNDKWVPFSAPDVQLEAVMLDPYIRRTLRSHPATGLFTAHFTLPDQYGVYTLKVDYKRHGYSYITEQDTIQVRPFRHDQYPRFLSAAWPYYVNTFSLMVAFVLFSGVFLWNREESGPVVVSEKVKAK